MSEQSKIVQFIGCRSNDYRGRSLTQLRIMSDEALEHSHDVMQWLFPLDVRSNHNPNCPIVSPKDIAFIAEDTRCRCNMKMNFERLFRFYECGDHWITPNNVNFIRIMRILRSMWLFDLKKEYCMLQHCLDEVFQEHQYAIGEKTFCHWKNANIDEYMKHPRSPLREDDEYQILIENEITHS